MPARKRIDPQSVPTDGYRSPERLHRRDPERHYVWVNPNDEDCGCSAYLAEGYEFEKKADDGVIVPRGTAKEDGVWTFKGQKLMSCPKGLVDAVRAQGQTVSDLMDRRMLKDGNIEDGLRGRGYSLGIDREQTTKQYTETEGA